SVPHYLLNFSPNIPANQEIYTLTLHDALPILPVPSDKKLVKLSKLIPAPASFCFKLLETIVDITVLVNDSPPKTKTNIIVSNHGVTSKKKAAIKKLTERNVTPMINTYNGPFLSTSNPPI